MAAAAKTPWPRAARGFLLQLFDEQFTDLDRPPVVLNAEPSFREPAVLGADGDDAVQLDGDLGALGVDLVGVPAAAGLVHGIHHGDIDEASRAVRRIRVLVPDLRLISAG